MKNKIEIWRHNTLPLEYHLDRPYRKIKQKNTRSGLESKISNFPESSKLTFYLSHYTQIL